MIAFEQMIIRVRILIQDRSQSLKNAGNDPLHEAASACILHPVVQMQPIFSILIITISQRKEKKKIKETIYTKKIYSVISILCSTHEMCHTGQLDNEEILHEMETSSTTQMVVPHANGSETLRSWLIVIGFSFHI